MRCLDCVVYGDTENINHWLEQPFLATYGLDAVLQFQWNQVHLVGTTSTYSANDHRVVTWMKMKHPWRSFLWYGQSQNQRKEHSELHQRRSKSVRKRRQQTVGILNETLMPHSNIPSASHRRKCFAISSNDYPFISGAKLKRNVSYTFRPKFDSTFGKLKWHRWRKNVKWVLHLPINFVFFCVTI